MKCAGVRRLETVNLERGKKDTQDERELAEGRLMKKWRALEVLKGATGQERCLSHPSQAAEESDGRLSDVASRTQMRPTDAIVG